MGVSKTTYQKQLATLTKERKMPHDFDEETEVPTSAPVTAAPAARRIIRSGWEGVSAVKDADSPYATRLRVEDEPIIIKFLSDEPYASWRQHWVERQGQKSFVCISEFDECPLCDSGNRPSIRIAFNVVLLASDGNHALRSYEVGPRVIDQLKNFHNDPRTGPLSKHFWAVSKTGKGATSATAHQLVRDRDLEEWGINNFTDSDLAYWTEKAYTADIIQIPTRTDLLAIAAEEN
jgi:hypothetical protein